MSAPSITCPKCHRVSYHPDDIANRYCGACHAFHADLARQEIGRELKVSELKPRTIVWLAKEGRAAMATLWVVEVGDVYVHFRAGAVRTEFFATRRGEGLEQICDGDLTPMHMFQYLGEP